MGEFLRGPRFVDLPIRLVLLLLAVGGVAPSAFESEHLLYVAFSVLASVLVVVVGFFPLGAGTIGLAAALIFSVLFPDYLNPLFAAGIAASAVILSHFRIGSFSIFSAVFFSCVLVVATLSEVERGTEALAALVFGWLLGAVLGLAAGLFEKRIQSEIIRREDAARDRERDIERLRLNLALDTHDTVSHGLAAQGAIVRMIGIDARMAGREDPRLTELALINGHTQQQLRLLLSRLTGSLGRTAMGGGFAVDVAQSMEMIRSATEAGGFDLEFITGELPVDVPAETAEIAMFVLKEIATNIVKHASERSKCVIHADSEERSDQRLLCFKGINVCDGKCVSEPRSLTTRVRQAGGTCTVTCGGGVHTVVAQMRLP